MLFPQAIDRRSARTAAAGELFFSRLISLILFACVGLLSGCSDVHITGTSPQPPAPPAGPPPSSGQTGTVTITPQYAAIAPGQSFQFSASSSDGGAIQWSASAGSVDSSGKYTAPSSISQSENVTITAALVSAPQQNNATAVVSIIQPGQIQCPSMTGNPQVAQYAVYLPAPGKASVEFGTSTNYGLNTWQLPTPSSNGGQVQLWVAGMLAKTTYHMRGQVTLDDGASFNDADQVCTTGALPFPGPSPVAVTNLGRAPQPGIEMWNTVLPQTYTQLFATDLKGNVIWTYSYQHTVSDVVQGVQLLPNGNLLMVISFLSSTNGTTDPNLINEVREVDLAGNTVRSVTVSDVNQKLAAMHAADASGTPYVLKSFHHNVLVLPNGHWVLLAAYAKGLSSNVTGVSGNTVVLGDALIDVDQNGNPDWEWSIFDHLDPSRHPMNFPDWTHSNAMLYSADDHNLLLSVRHQNWILKIDFQDGTGSGDVLWKLGYQGDFTLEGGNDPKDWFYAQHGMSYTTSNTTGIFGLMMMDNGNDRYLTPNQQLHCNPFAGGSGPTTLDPNCYSTMPVLQINENTKTATLIHNYAPGTYGTYGKPPKTITGNSFFSFFGGNAELLANGDYEVTFAATVGQAGIVQELDPTTLQPVWQANTPNADQFHANRWPSLYPGVQW